MDTEPRGPTVRGTIFRRIEHRYDVFDVSLETPIGALIQKFYPGEKITLTYQGNLLAPVYPLRLYNFKEGDVIVAIDESEVSNVFSQGKAEISGDAARQRFPHMPGKRRLFVRTAETPRPRLRRGTSQ